MVVRSTDRLVYLWDIHAWGLIVAVPDRPSIFRNIYDRRFLFPVVLIGLFRNIYDREPLVPPAVPIGLVFRNIYDRRFLFPTVPIDSVVQKYPR